MPVAFIRDFHTAEALILNSEERKLFEFLKSSDSANESTGTDYAVSLAIDIKFRRSRTSPNATEVRITNAPNAIPVKLEEQNIRDTYPWDYEILTAQLTKRYSDFKINDKYHKIRRPLENEDRLCKTRLLDPGNPKSQKKRFYNPNILAELDKHYTRTAATSVPSTPHTSTTPTKAGVSVTDE